MIKFFKFFYEGLGTSKGQRFRRFTILLALIGIIIMLIVNVGYDKSKGGFYLKPIDVSINKAIQ